MNGPQNEIRELIMTKRMWAVVVLILVSITASAAYLARQHAAHDAGRVREVQPSKGTLFELAINGLRSRRPLLHRVPAPGNAAVLDFALQAQPSNMLSDLLAIPNEPGNTQSVARTETQPSLSTTPED